MRDYFEYQVVYFYKSCIERLYKYLNLVSLRDLYLFLKEIKDENIHINMDQFIDELSLDEVVNDIEHVILFIVELLSEVHRLSMESIYDISNENEYHIEEIDQEAIIHLIKTPEFMRYYEALKELKKKKQKLKHLNPSFRKFKSLINLDCSMYIKRDNLLKDEEFKTLSMSKEIETYLLLYDEFVFEMIEAVDLYFIYHEKVNNELTEKLTNLLKEPLLELIVNLCEQGYSKIDMNMTLTFLSRKVLSKIEQLKTTKGGVR